MPGWFQELCLVHDVIARHMRVHHIKVRGLAVECLLRAVINLTCVKRKLGTGVDSMEPRGSVSC
jgi:hypothetical protein